MRKIRSRIEIVFTTSLLFLSSWCFAQEPNLQEIEFFNGEIKLAGTLVTPEGNGPFPAIVFLHGSGPATREGALSYALKFADIGITSLVYDKRGSGESTASWITASIVDLANDAKAAINFLLSQDQIDTTKIGLWGVSQAGWVGPMVATRSKKVSFGIFISGGGASPLESELFSYQNTFMSAGLSKEEIRKGNETIQKYFDYLATGKDRDQLLAALKASESEKWYALTNLHRIVPSVENRSNWSWVATYNPSEDIEQLTIPLLLMFGQKDNNHPTKLALKRWEKSLHKANNKNVTIKIFPEAGHGIRLRHLEGMPFAEGYEETMIEWLKDITRR